MVMGIEQPGCAVHAERVRQAGTIEHGEHAFRFARSALGWHKAAVRSPAQFGRWTWIILCAITQLRLARALAEDHRHAWERRRRPGRLTPGRVPGVSPAWPPSPARRPARRNLPKPDPAAPKAAAAPQHHATT